MNEQNNLFTKSKTIKALFIVVTVFYANDCQYAASSDIFEYKIANFYNNQETTAGCPNQPRAAVMMTFSCQSVRS